MKDKRKWGMIVMVMLFSITMIYAIEKVLYKDTESREFKSKTKTVQKEILQKELDEIINSRLFNEQEEIHQMGKYSDALLMALLPRISTMVKDLNLSVGLPLDPERMRCLPHPTFYPGCCIETTEKEFLFDRFGNVYSYSDIGSRYVPLGEDDENKRVVPFWKRKMSHSEIVDYARKILEKIGYTPELTQSDKDPIVEGPFQSPNGNTSYVTVVWRSSTEEKIDYSNVIVQFYIETKEVIFLFVECSIENRAKYFSDYSKKQLKLNIKPETERDYLKRVYGKRGDILGQLIHTTPAYSNAVASFFIPKVSEVVKCLDIPITHPVTLDQIKLLNINKYGYVAGSIVLTNDWSFSFEKEGYLSAIKSPRSFFVGDTGFVHPELFVGTNNMTDDEIILFAKNILKKLEYPRDFELGEPTKFRGPSVRYTNDETFPHASVYWYGEGYYFHVDVNTERKEVEYIYIGDSGIFSPFEIDMIPETEAAYQARVQKEKEAAGH